VPTFQCHIHLRQICIWDYIGLAKYIQIVSGRTLSRVAYFSVGDELRS
jgi:hypothetical protein